MSHQERKIECRRCHEHVPMTAESCPHCGASVRNTRAMVAVGVFGALIVGASLLNLSQLWVFGLVGLVLVLTASYLVYDKRQRVEAATEASAGIADATSE